MSTLIRPLRVCWLLLLLLGGLTTQAQQGKLLETFTVKDVFGVSHPMQIIDFDLNTPVDAKNSYLVDANNIEVPYQLLNGGKKLAVRTDLPANTEKSWKLYGGRAPKPAATGLKVVKTADYYEIVGDVTGVRIPVPPANLAATPAPVAGIRLRDGTWTATGPATLSMTAKSMTVTPLEQGPLKIVAQVRYTFNRPDKRAYDGRLLIPAGEGFYTSTITVALGQPSVLFEEESDCDLSYAINFANGLQPTQARYRGHHSNSKEAGYEADGRQYRQWHERLGMDAFVDFKFDIPRNYRKLAIWDPWIFDGGWYWQFYNDKAPATANLCGIFAGPASRAHRTEWSGVNAFTAPRGVTDLTTQLDAAGNLHALYQSGDELWYVKFDPRLIPGKPEKVAAGLIHPDLLVREDGSVAVAACARGSNSFFLAERGANGTFTAKPIAFVEGETLKPSQPFIYQASSGGTDYLFFFGSMKELSGGLLFTRKRGEAAFILQEAVKDAAGSRQVERPVFTRLPDGGVGLLFSFGQYAETGWIAPGGVSFAGTATQRRLFNDEKTRLLNFGAALDPQTGAAVVGDNRGTLTYIGQDGKVIASPALTSADHQGQGPNRRTAAMAPDGTILAMHNGELFLLADGKWSAFAPGNAMKLVGPRVHFNKANGQFLIIGRKDGMLATCTWKPGEAVPQLACQLPETDQRAMGLTIAFYRGDDNPPGAGRWTDRVRFAWGLFIGTKGDLADPYQVQPIARQMNIHAGVNLNKISRIQLDFPDPKGGFGSPFMDRKSVAAMIEKLREDKGGAYGGGFHQYLFNAEPYSRDLVTMWADPTGKQNEKAVKGVLEGARSLLDGYINGDGIYDMHCHYWHGGLAMNSRGIWADQVLASPFTTPEDRARVKAALALFGNILWDDDFVPLFDGSGVGLGTENMPVQQIGYRRFFAMLLDEHPSMKTRAKAVQEGALQTVRHIVNEHGAEIGCVHYIGASFAPTLTTLLQIKQLGEMDPFKVEPRLAKFADFYMNFQTPPELRFGTTRKNISTGDGPTESSEILGMLGTGFREANPELAAKLMWSWNAGGKVHSGFFGTTFLMIDDKAPVKDPQLGSANFPGYYSVLRHGWGTPNETALWFVNGDFYRDHRHNDRGIVIMYALGLPLSLDWGPQYAPHVGGGIMHSAVLLEGMLGQPWDQDVKNLNNGGTWGSANSEAFAGFRTAAYSRGKMTSGGTSWTRETCALHPNEAYPMLLIRDTFAGEQAAAPKVFTLNLMAEGAVQTPAGPMTPPVRTWGDGYNDKITHEYPSAGQLFNLPPGINRLGFTGVQFGMPEKPLPGIDFDLYTVSDAPQQAHIGNWADNWVGGAAGDFQRVNGKTYEERQHILRIKGTGTFTTVIQPYRKGQKRETTVTREGALLVIKTGEERTTVGDSFYSFAQGQKRVLATLGTEKAAGEGITAEGGPVEVLLDGATAIITVSGAAGTRTITLPGAWKAQAPKAPAKFANGAWAINYAGGEPVTVVLERP